jgi:hypothetical protein
MNAESHQTRNQKQKMKPTSSHILILAAALGFVGAANAATTITYSTQVISSAASTSWVSPTNTTSLSAFNFGGDETSYGGVTWSDATDVGGWATGNPTLTPWANFSKPGIGWGINNPDAFYSSGTPLLSAGSYMTESDGQIDMSNFTVGKHYQIQFVLADSRNEGYAIGRTIQIQGLGGEIAGQNSTTVQYAYGDGAQFAVVTADFVAGATSYSFIPYQAGNGTGTQINGLQVLEVIPEPSTALLGGLGLLALLRRRR